LGQCAYGQRLSKRCGVAVGKTEERTDVSIGASWTVIGTVSGAVIAIKKLPRKSDTALLFAHSRVNCPFFDIVNVKT
jgi:hypothetical protein